MNVEFINPFLESTINVIETMAFTKATPGKPTMKKGNKSWGPLSGIIGLASSELSGNLILSFDKPAILGIVSSMLGEEISEISPDVIDAVGELTNMVSGGAKAILSQKGHKFDMATPIMLVGKDVEITQLSKASVISIPFKTDKGEFVVEVTLHPVK
ncbi:MAG: chemotaxis protein CheX [Deltaproteobacteria bacterium]|nr:chemotaxis protein CheX [Deltaproteobacteria bacterium]